MSLVAIAGTAVAVYAVVLVYTRIAGLRSFAKMPSFDFAMPVAIGSIVASSILNETPSVPQTAVALGAVYALQMAVGSLRTRWPWFQHLVDNEPLLLMDGPTVLHANLRRARVSEDDLRSKLRAAGVTDLGRVRAVVMETTGDVSVLTGDPSGPGVDAWLTRDVRRGEPSRAGRADG